MNLPTVTEAPCRTDNPGGDEDMLILKPELLTACTGEFTFKTFLRNAAGETEVTSGLTYASLSPSVVTINASTGVATLLAAGVGTVSVTDGTLIAAAQVEVVGSLYDCCADHTVATLVLIDNSASMASPMTFYPGSRLAFTKATAFAAMDGMRLDKDKVGLSRFNLNVTWVQSISSSLPTLDTVESIPQTNWGTDILEMLQRGIAALDEVTADRKVLMIFSDGEHCTGPLSPGEWDDIISVASNFKASGGIIVVCGCAASGNGFDLLQQIASGGFFFNPTDSVTTLAAAETLIGLMCFYCGGLPPYYGQCLDSVLGAQTPHVPALPEVEF